MSTSGRKVPILRALLNHTYCSSKHERIHSEELNQMGLLRLMQMTSEGESTSSEAQEDSKDPCFTPDGQL